jgi:lysyl-tRNA synthetase class II
MNLNLEELMVLANAGTPKTPQTLAALAVAQYQNPRFDSPVALVKVGDMVQRGLLMKNKNGTVEVSFTGWSELLNSIQPLQQLLGNLSMIQYRVVR